MFVIGVLVMLLPAGGAGLLAWENRNVMVRLHAGPYVWTAHLYGVFIVGALAACWFLLGLSFIRCRIAERRAAKEPAVETAPEPTRSTRPRAVTPALR